jgi:potassium efflux system protein
MIFPGYLLLLSALIKPGADQFYSAFLSSRLLLISAAISQVWLLSRIFFRPDGIAVRRFQMPAPLASSLRHTLNIWALGALLLLVPQHLFSRPPFEFIATPRLLYTAMEILVLITLVMLLRPHSPLMSALFSDDTRTRLGHSQRREQAHRLLQRHWGAISLLLSAFLTGVVVLDMLGFRYTAQRLSISVVLTVFIAAALLTTYWVVVTTLKRFMWQRLSSPADAPSTQTESDPQRLERQVKRGLRGLLTLAGAMLLALAWNIGSGDTLPLKGIQLYSVVASDGTRGYVTASDMLDFLLVLILLGWLLRELKALFKLLIFPYLQMDRGKRYALVTISRYLVFILGAIVSLNILQVNFGNLGWLVAAMGVGLGFGLQEIFANFISGLILLIERPIRVGDLVTIGNVMGNVTHISFRATTVAAFDNEEILIPNKELITGQVTNWTLGSTITRIVVPIQAAYGSDVDQVSDILMAIAVNDPEVLSDPAPAALFMAHGDSGLDFELRVFLGASGVRLSTRDRLNRQINKAFSAHGIEIPYPQSDLHIRSMPWPDGMPSPSADTPPAPAGAAITTGAHNGDNIA